ncbi:MAG: helix-turn-helix domain-containing protein [Pseudorhodoplanes sp.]
MVRASTDQLPVADRFSYWADVVAQTFVPLECDAPARRSFSGSIRHRRMARVGITEVSASAQRVTRTRAKIAQAPSNDCIFVVNVDGRCHVGQRSQIELLGAAEGAVVSACETYFFEFPEAFRQIVLKIPRSLMGVAPMANTGPTLRLACGPAHLLRHLALAVLEGSDEISAAEESATERALVELLRSACTRPASDHRDMAAAPSRYEAALDFIGRSFSDPGLTPAAVAAHVGLSPRSLSRLFARNGRTIERSIWSRRLIAARDELADPRLRHRSITDVAFACGFNDAAHFSRSFLNAYGMTPRRFRADH